MPRERLTGRRGFVATSGLARMADQRGAALITALVILGAFSAMAAVHALNVQAALRIRGAGAERRVGYYAAEGGLNAGVMRFANIFRDGRRPAAGDLAQTLTLDDYEVAISLDESPSCSPCAPTRIPIGEVFAGLNSIPYRYTIHARSGRAAGETAAHLAGEFDIHNVPVFQFLAFTDAPLFVMPLHEMVVHGRVHSNGDIYFQPDQRLAIQDLPGVVNDVQVTAVGDVYRGGRKYDAGWRCWGDVSIDKLEDVAAPPADLDPLAMACGSSSPLAKSELDAWLGSVRSGVRNVVAPSMEILERGSGPYWQNADLRIVLRLDQVEPAIDFGAADLCPGAPASPPGLYAIEVQTASGERDVARTRQLLRFMCERRGALFYNDVPIVAPVPPDSGVALLPSNYLPAFADAGRIYRRAGEDTSGDGAVDGGDSNVDVCPSGAGAPPPWFNAATCPPYADPPVANRWYLDTDYRRGGFFNHRERQWMYLLNLDLRALIEWNALAGDVFFPRGDTSDEGLVIYLSVQGPDSAAMNNYGVRVFDSADLDGLDATFAPGAADPTGVTVVSDQLAIVGGNFNTADKVPAAVLGDAVYLLSQGWEVPVAGVENDHKSTFDLASDIRDVPAADSPGGASFTAAGALGVNAALLSGLGASTLDPDWYNGGIENSARLLESWSGRALVIRGSFVSLGEPRHKLNHWHCGSGNACNIYDPPLRIFDYDGDFDRVENLPPMTPRFVYLQQRMVTRFYE